MSEANGHRAVQNRRPGQNVRRGLALRLAVPLAAACLAALAAHIAIDIAGDFVLPHDAYDDPNHGSRRLASLAAAGLGLAGFWAVLRAALAETRGSSGALRSTLRAALPLGPAAFAGLVAALTLPLVLGMAWLDASCSGIALDDAGDLLGGSIPLGAGLTVAFGIAAGLGVHRLLTLLCRFHRSIVRAVEAFVRPARAVSSALRILVASNTQDRPRVLAALARCTGANRAPPGPVAVLLTA